MQKQIPHVVIARLPMYLRELSRLHDQGMEFVSSMELASSFGTTSEQVRKDLSCLGRFGRQGRGYSVSLLIRELRQVLGLNREWRLAIVGVGRLGKAILDYRGFTLRGFRIVAAFDKDESLIGREVSGIAVRPISELDEALLKARIDMAIVAVPGGEAQKVIDKLVACGVRSILNYAPICAKVPAGVHVEAIDPVLGLQSMTYYLGKTYMPE